MATAGERFSEFVLAHLKEHKIVNEKGQPSLGRVNGKTLAELYDKFESAERRRGKKVREATLSKADRDKLFEALALGCGMALANMTDQEVKKTVVANAAIVRATPDVTPDEVSAACNRYRQLYPTILAVSPTAVSGAWSRLLERNRPAGRSLARLDEPQFDWARVIAVRFPRDHPGYENRGAWEEGTWAEVPYNIKQGVVADGPAILKAVSSGASAPQPENATTRL